MQDVTTSGGIVQLSILQFSLIYLLLLIVAALMKKSKIDQTKLLVVASTRMTVQLVLAGLILSYLFKNPHPVFTVLYVFIMIGFAIRRAFKRCPEINKRFKLYVALSIAFADLFVILFFIGGVIQVNVFNPQYAIPISGMIIGNSMTGITLGIRAFTENIKANSQQIETLLNIGVTPERILRPFIKDAFETAYLPTLNNMIGMGIVSLPGMMTGQILSGTLPLTAIMYQIAIMIAISTATCLTVFSALNLGYKTLYNNRNQFVSSNS